MRDYWIVFVVFIACVLMGYFFNNCDFDGKVESGAVQVNIYMDAGLCGSDADCENTDYPTCLRIGETGVCVDCYEDDDSQQSICGVLLAFTE